MLNKFIKIPNWAKRLILVLADSFLIITALWGSFSIRLGELYYPFASYQSSNEIKWDTVSLFLLAPVIAIPIFIQCGLYRAIIRYLSMQVAWLLIKATTLYAVLWGLLAFLSGGTGIPRSVVFINAMLSFFLLGGARFIMSRLLMGQRSGKNDKSTVATRIVIYGAGDAGRQLAVSLLQSREHSLFGFVDDRRDLEGRDLMGVPVIGVDVLNAFVELHKITDLLLAIPSITRKKRNIVIERLRLLPLRIRTLPGLTDLVRGEINFSNLNELEIDDLLLRNPAEPNEALLRSQVSGQVVLVTGAGGSIGSEICVQVLNRFPKVLLLLELNEYALFNITNQLSLIIEQIKAESAHNSHDLYALPKVVPLLGSVQDEGRLQELMQIWKPKRIYHTAAYKHVPLVEENITEGIKNNVFGTLTVAKVAIEQEVSNVVLISTDKAVRPTNIMGCSKRIAEMILQALMAEETITFALAGESPMQTLRNTHFSMVRFGNVLGSSGSVVPLFRKQIQNGGPITLTDKEIVRYFMTIPEAAQLVMQAGGMHEDAKENNHLHKGVAAEVFVLNMGEEVKIYDLARRMIELSGLRVKDESCPKGDITIQITGLRPGEKLYEELLIGDNPQPTKHPRILKAHEEFIPWSELQLELNTLRIAVEKNDVKMIRLLLKKLVKGYQPKNNLKTKPFTGSRG